MECKLRSLPSPLPSFIVANINDCSFLLANRHMRRIVSAISARDLQQILGALSTNLDEVWGFCMERFNCQSPNKRALAERALSWVSITLRSLTDMELTQALSYRPGDTNVNSRGSIDVFMIIEIRTACFT
jgi:hypothetical protein